MLRAWQHAGVDGCSHVTLATTALRACRCFPKFPASFTGSVYSVINTTSGVLGSAAAAAQDSWGSDGSLFSTYIADISKGVLIIVIGGLGCGMALSLVRAAQGGTP
jgi:hypothetical protein